MHLTESNDTNKQSNHPKIAFVAILICAQIACASTASCVKALPAETPSALRGLWRQTLTSALFSVLSVVLHCPRSKRGHAAVDDDNDSSFVRVGRDEIGDSVEDATLLSRPRGDKITFGEGIAASPEEEKEGAGFDWFSVEHVALVALAVIGATLQNDAIVIALHYASSAAVMCLCNTTPIWLILFSFVNCKTEMPGTNTIVGSILSLMGAIVCSTGKGGDVAVHENESLGTILATTGGIGGAIYMTSCHKLAPLRLHPIHLSLMINIGMMIATFSLCLMTLPDGIAFFSTDISRGFFGFLNSHANPPALLQSMFPDLVGNFGIILSLSQFDPLIVSLVMMTEPLNASVIAMYAIDESPPSLRTIIGVSIVIAGCAIVLFESKKDVQAGLEMTEMGEEDGYGSIQYSTEERNILESTSTRRMRSSIVLYAQLGRYAPAVEFVESLDSDFNRTSKLNRLSLPPSMFRNRVELNRRVTLARNRTT